MKRFMFLALLTVLLPGLVLAQDDRRDRDRGQGENSHQGHPGHNRQRHNNNNIRNNAYRGGHVSGQFKNMGVRSYPKPYARGQLLAVGRNRSSIAFPSRGPGGMAIHANVFARTNFSSNPVIRAHMSIITGGAFRAQIGIYNANERIVGNYYWHTGNGFNYCHYYDRWGYHWYGWYLGNSYFWTRWYSNNYWWYDPALYRWCYWHDGGWWWQDPNTASLYIYNNGSYMPADGNVNNQVQTNAPGAPASNVQGTEYFSPDSTREVKLVGLDAFLYDISGNNSFKPVYLGSNVTGVKFSNTNNGKPLQVMLTLNDGSFEVFDGQGNSLTGGDNGASSNNQAPPDNASNQDNGASDSGNGANQPPTGQPPTGGNPPPMPGSGT